MSSPPTAFLSYASPHRAWVQVLADNLSRFDVQVFLDHEGIRPGQPWWTRIQQEIPRAAWLVLVVTPEAMASPWVAEEVAAFEALRPGCRLVPILLSWAPLPPFLEGRQHVDFETTAYEGAFRRLAAMLREIPEELLAPSGIRVPPPPARLRSGLWKQLCAWLAPALERRANRRAMAAELDLPRDALDAFATPALAANALLTRTLQEADPTPCLTRIVEVTVALELRDAASARPVLDALRQAPPTAPTTFRLPPDRLARVEQVLGLPATDLAELGPWGEASVGLVGRLLTAADQDPALAEELHADAGTGSARPPMQRLGDRLVALSERPVARKQGLNREAAFRLSGFRGIFRELSGIPDGDWVGGARRDGHTDGPATPFVRVAGATATHPLSIRLVTTPFATPDLRREYRLDTALKRNLAEVRRMGRTWTNDPKLRIASARVDVQATHTDLLLQGGRSRYEDYLCTHWSFANLPDRATRPQRDQLFQHGRLSDLDRPPHFSNQLGVSAFVVSKDGWILLPVQARSSVASAGLVVPSVSGSADWEPGYVDGDPIATQDIRREALEELALDQEQVVRVVPLAFCRDALRGGTPELFFVIFTSLDVDDLKLSMEHERNEATPKAVENARMIPALVGADHQPFDDLANRRQEYDRALEVRADRLHDRSPFVDALLHLYLAWCAPCLDAQGRLP